MDGRRAGAGVTRALLLGVTFFLGCAGETPAPRTVLVETPPQPARVAPDAAEESAEDAETRPVTPRKSAPLADAPPPQDLLPPECELYLGRMQACVSKLPPDARKTLEEGMQQMRDVWRSITDESGMQAVRMACQSGAEAWAEMPLCK